MFELFPPPLGTRIADRFELQSPLRGDGPVQAFLVHDHQTGRRRALSLFDRAAAPPHVWTEYARIVAVAVAARIPGLVLPPHVPPTAPDPPHVIEEPPAHRSLDRLYAQEGRLPWQRALTLGERIATILHAAHAATGIGHRALTPSRILVDPRDDIEILDYAAAEIELSGDPPDDLGYRAPEQRTSKGDHRSDIYTLATILHELIYGVCPTGAVQARPATSALVPPNVDRLLRQSLVHDPAQRPADLAALRAAIREQLGLPALPTHAASTPPTPSPPTPSKPVEHSSAARTSAPPSATSAKPASPAPRSPPTEPAKPALPTHRPQPSEPAKPALPTHRPQPSEPAKPALPTHRPQPSEPAKPAQLTHRPQPTAPINPPIERTEKLAPTPVREDTTLQLPGPVESTERLPLAQSSKPPPGDHQDNQTAVFTRSPNLRLPPQERTETLSDPQSDRTLSLSPAPGRDRPQPLERTELLSPPPRKHNDEDQTLVMTRQAEHPAQPSSSQLDPTLAFSAPPPPRREPAPTPPAARPPDTTLQLTSSAPSSPEGKLRTALIWLNVLLGAVLLLVALWIAFG